MNPADVAQSALPLASTDVSLIALFLQAHWIVKAVMLGLLGCSVWVWAIAIDKMFLYARTKRAMDRFEQAFWSGQSIEELYRALSAKPTQSMAACFVAAMREWKRSFESQTRSFAGLQMRIEKVMNVSIAREIERLERRLLVLATVGSAGPFVGLFGTVWGIMSSFQSIAASKNTSLAVVAPGIAEALFATAIGLIAAIPATIFYNKFTSEVNRQAQRLEGFADEFSAILSRQIDERAGRADRCQHQQPALQPFDFPGDGDVHDLFDPHLKSGKGPRLALERAFPFPHRGHETGRHRLRRLGRQRAIQLLDRLARPERLLETVHGALGARIQEHLVDRDRPHPDRTRQQPQHHRFHDPMGLQEQRDQRDIGRGERQG